MNEIMKKAWENYEAGNLGEAIYAVENAIKQFPNDIFARSFLVELLCITGNLDRADRQLELLKHQFPDAVMGIILLRQLIRAAAQRQNYFAQGLTPKLMCEPTDQAEDARQRCNQTSQPILKHSCRAKYDGSNRLFSGICNGKSFEVFRDLDDVCAYNFEIFTQTGDYYWLPMERVKSLQFHVPGKKPLDLLWRFAKVEFWDGQERGLYFPVVYCALDESESSGVLTTRSSTTDLQSMSPIDQSVSSNDEFKMGRQTKWYIAKQNEIAVSGTNRPEQHSCSAKCDRYNDWQIMRGLGQRTFLVGEEAVPMLEVEALEFYGD